MSGQRGVPPIHAGELVHVEVFAAMRAPSRPE